MNMETDKIFPDNWKEMIQGKKVIFYNTSVGSLLSGREKHIKKMKWVFDIFRQYPEVVLWWRPHPLELSTIESMVPQLTKQYIDMRKQYQENQIGILDESTDLHRAIAISDAYYGDWSSVTHLYKAVKKPVLYQNDSVTNAIAASFLPVALCIKERAIWFIQLNSNKLIMVDRVTYEVKKTISIPLEPPYLRRAYNYHVIDIGNSLLLLLENSRRIYEYEIITDTMNVHEPQVGNFVFHSEAVIEKNGKLIMFSCGSNGILEYDWHTTTITKRGCGQKNIKFAKCHEIIEERVYLVDGISNTIYQYNLTDASLIMVSVGQPSSKYWGIKKAGRYFVLPHTEKKTITLWNEENGEITELMVFPQQYAYLEKFAYLDMFEKNGNMYIFPFYANMILKIDIENRTIMQAFTDIFFNTKYDFNTEQISGGMYLCAKQYDDCVYAYATYKTCWQVLNLETMDVQESPLFEVIKSEHKNLLESIWDDGEYDASFCEGEDLANCNLENYIKNLLENNSGNRHCNIEKSSVGQNIYQYINCL